MGLFQKIGTLGTDLILAFDCCCKILNGKIINITGRAQQLIRLTVGRRLRLYPVGCGPSRDGDLVVIPLARGHHCPQPVVGCTATCRGSRCYACVSRSWFPLSALVRA